MKTTKTQRMRKEAVDGAMCVLRKKWSLSAEQKDDIRERLEALWDEGLQRGIEIAAPDWERDLIG